MARNSCKIAIYYCYSLLLRLYLFERFILFHFLLVQICKINLFRIYEGFYDCSETVELSVKAQNKWLLSLVAIKTLRDLSKYTTVGV